MRPAPANLCHRSLPDRPSPCLLTSQVHQAISYAAIAALARNRRSALATVAALIGGLGAFCGAITNVFVFPGLAAAATAHTTRAAAAQFLVTTSNSEFSQVFRVRIFHRHLRRAAAHGDCPVAKPERSALAGGPVLRWPGSRPAADILRARRDLVHAALCGSDGPAGGPDLAGGYVAIQPATRRTDQRPRIAARKGSPQRYRSAYRAASTAARSEQKAGQGGAGLAHPRVPGRENLEETHEARPRLVPLLP